MYKIRHVQDPFRFFEKRGEFLRIQVSASRLYDHLKGSMPTKNQRNSGDIPATTNRSTKTYPNPFPFN